MTRTATTSLIALALALSAGSAMAAGQVNNETGAGVFAEPVAAASKSRDQVRAELAEAVRSGAVIVNNATGETVRSADASRFVGGFESQVTREQVKAELAEAVRNGQVIANNATLETVGDRS